ncbi:hypothetical protein VIBNIFTn2_120006 [Vibrio nigripulchritudo FTn2]|uniref:hypothetical protein n=1 Tax=Vibrio nigripulchritudo TaxID=28173 RepID=UPI0003B1E6D0|nr:hypothetical protein [Vibrio nigripulchritudo]CCN40024.1 hypothetical protein VIBNIFTn2_120006 [Vibrio nigripulchritudo FTn2]
MTNSTKRNGLAWGRYLGESVVIVPHEQANLMTPLFQVLNEPAVIKVDTYSGFATISNNEGETSRCKITHEPKNGDLIPVLVDDKLGIRVELDRFKVSLRCFTSEHLVPKRLEKVERIPSADIQYEEVVLDDLKGIEGYVTVNKKIQDLKSLKQDIHNELHEQAITRERQSYLGYMLDMVKVDIERCQSLESELKVSLLSDLEYAQKFMDATLVTLDSSVIQKIQEKIE